MMLTDVVSVISWCWLPLKQQVLIVINQLFQ